MKAIKILGFVGLLSWMIGPLAQVLASRTAIISFSPPTTYTDGTAIEPGASITYKLYQAVKGQTKVFVRAFSVSGEVVKTGLVPGATNCFEVTAVVGQIESARSNEACKDISAAGPTSAVVITVS